MTRKPFEQDDWPGLIEAHPLESHDPEEWLRYGVALLQTMTPGPAAGKQQQQAALAFVQAQKEGASLDQVIAAQRDSVIISLKAALDVVCYSHSQQMNQGPSSGTLVGSGDQDIANEDQLPDHEGDIGSTPYHYRTAVPLRFSFLERRNGKAVLQSTHNYGYFSCLSTILWDLITCANCHQLPDVVGSQHGMRDFKDQDGVDLFARHFQPPSKAALEAIPLGNELSIPAHHGDYGRLNHQQMGLFLDAYFQPQSCITSLVSRLIEKYQIQFDNLLAVCYRGTDKWMEVDPVPAAEYVLKIRAILQQHSELRVLVQTDQRQVRDYLLYELGDRAFAIEELPVTDGPTVMHQTLEGNRQDFADVLLAINLIMARARWLVTHTGNMAFWTVLLRRHGERVEQFGALLDP